MRDLIVYIRPLAIVGAAGFYAGCLMAAPLPMTNCDDTASQTLKPLASQLPESSAGYRVTAMRFDPLLQQRWAVVRSCDHPDAPAFMVAMPTGGGLKSITNSQKTVKPRPLTVHAGDVLRVWSYEDFFRIETTGVAKENAALGDRLNVFLLRPGSNGYSGGQLRSDIGSPTIRAVVRGSHEVEIER